MLAFGTHAGTLAFPISARVLAAASDIENKWRRRKAAEEERGLEPKEAVGLLVMGEEDGHTHKGWGRTLSL